MAQRQEEEARKFLDSPKILDPLPSRSALFDAIKGRRDDTHIVESITPKAKSLSSGSTGDYFADEPSTFKDDKLTSLIEDANILSDQEILDKVRDEQPVASTSKLTDSIEIPKVKSRYSDLFEAIRGRRNDKDVVEGSNIQKDVEPVASTSQLNEDNKPLHSALLKDIKSHRVEYGTPILKSQEELLREVETQLATPKIDTPKSGLSVILDKVKGLVSPKIETKTPIEQYPDTKNLYDDTENLFNSDDDDDVPSNINTTDWHSTSVRLNKEEGTMIIDFADKLQEVKEMIILFNDGIVDVREVDPRTSLKLFSWNEDNNPDLEVLTVVLVDKNNIKHQIFKNDDYKLLHDFGLNYQKSSDNLKKYYSKN